MSKKKVAPQNCTIEELATEAGRHLNMGHYKEAIEIYKQLLKRESRVEWQRDLSMAYLERAKTLAQKAMYKEASVLWENRANLCGDESYVDLYIAWLFRGERYIQAVRVFVESLSALTEDTVQQYLLQFGALLLAGQSDIAPLFPKDSPIRQHYPHAHAAIHAYAQGDNAGTEAHLQKIPFRSPYRDLRTLLKALLLLETDPEAMTALLQKIPATSPYHPLSKLVEATHFEEIRLLEFLQTLKPAEQQFIFCLKGWDERLLKVVALSQVEDSRNYNKIIFETVIANREFFGESSRSFCQALLPSYLEGWRQFEKTFGSPSPFEKEQIHALANEHQEQFLIAERHWRRGVAILTEQANVGDNALKAALTLRHLVELAVTDKISGNNMAEDLEDSVQLDPSDRGTYLSLIRYYQTVKDDQKACHQWIDKAVEHFPQDNEFLLLAVEAANQRKAFKKAAHFAQTILKFDPINAKARQVLVASHLAHARKLMKSERYELVRKELNLAAQVERASQRTGIVQMNQGFLAYKMGQPSQAHTLIQEGLHAAGDGLIALLRLLVEGNLAGIPIKELSTFIPALTPRVLAKYVPLATEMGELLNIVNFYHEQKKTALKAAIALLEVPLKNVLKQKLPQDEMFNVCQCFMQVAQYSLLQEYATAALKRWPKSPAFTFFQIYGRIEGKVSQLSDKQFHTLDDAVDAAKHAGDERTAVMISRFLKEASTPNIEEFIDEHKIEEILRRLEEVRKPRRRRGEP